MDTLRPTDTSHTGNSVSPSRPRPGTGEEPVAVVGISCRLPGAADPEAFWQLLSDGDCAVGQVPPGREPVGGRWGAFIEGVDRFDAGFFGITPGKPP